MVAILASLLGFLTSSLPDVFKIFQDARDKKHELDILDKQIEVQKLGLTQHLEEVGIQADVEETKSLYATYSTGIHWVDALNGTVRPILAYAFFSLYAGIKILIAIYMISHGIPFIAPDADLPWLLKVNILIWGEDDMAIFVGIVSFYFGSRAMAKLRQ